jgi:predicted O-methyltransferase YrrM
MESSSPITVLPPPSKRSFSIYDLTTVLSRGLVVDDTDKNPYNNENWRKGMAVAMRDFNEYVKNEPRLETVVLPLFDGLGLMRLKD